MYKQQEVPRMRYQPSVKTGNWLEDHVQEISTKATLHERRDKGVLLCEMARKFVNNLQRPIQLDAPKIYIAFNTKIQIVSPSIKACVDDKSERFLALAIHGLKNTVINCTTVSDCCELCAAPSTRSELRNTFRIVSAHARFKDGDSVRYGDPFQLECVERDDDNDLLVLYAAAKVQDLSFLPSATFLAKTYGKLHLPLGIVKRKHIGPFKKFPSALTYFTCEHSKKKLRMRTAGQPIEYNMPLVIKHVVTNRKIALDNKYFCGLFGNEYLVSVDDYRLGDRSERPNNQWMIGNGQQMINR